ncbi:MAG: hypothetical protein NC434_10860 [Ruminococcus sp.]|nr:hypothetical protein [Ruminococcus sp.]
MSKFISIIGIILVMFGTILSLWSVLGTKGKYVQTAAWYDNQQQIFQKDKKRVIVGTVLIILGSLFQIIGILI